jgi:hypothetical protein
MELLSRAGGWMGDKGHNTHSIREILALLCTGKSEKRFRNIGFKAFIPNRLVTD